jgi:hypothetical protein
MAREIRMRVGITIVACAVTLACASAARLPPLDNEIRLPTEVDRRERPMADRPIPHFPDILRSGEVSGEVRVHYVVDATGHAVPSSFVVEKSSHELFTAAVKITLVKSVFSPAQLHGRRVAIRREEVFVFRAPPDHSPSHAAPKDATYAAFPVLTVAHDSTSDGVPRTVIEFIPPARAPNVKFSRDELLAAQRAVLAAVAPAPAQPGFSDVSIVTLCVSIRRDAVSAPADVETLRGLLRPGRRAVAPRDCPRTYSSMVNVVDSLGNPMNPAPPGWVDPYSLSVSDVEGWARDLVLVSGEVGHATGERGFVCRVKRVASQWTAECQRTWSRLH